MRGDGVGYGGYLEQITCLLFLKMVDEFNKPPYKKEIRLPFIKDVQENELKNAEDTKSGAGQYFTSRALVCPMVKCVQPKPMRLLKIWSQH
jgi:type I restriction-modification system DNA methylase subunit